MICKPSDRIQGVQEYYFASKLAEIALMDKEGTKVINLGIGSPDLPAHPAVTATLAAASLENQASMYQSYRGIPELRRSVADHYQQRFNVSINPDNQILPMIGSKEGIMHIAMSFLNPGDIVLVPNPGYPAYRATAIIAGAEVIEYELNESNDWLPDLEVLELIDLSSVKLMWINYPHMPTGAKMHLEGFEALINFAIKHNILLCHDNPYNYILNDRPLSIFQGPRAEECCLELFSWSKAYNMAGWRVGALIGAEAYINTVMRFKSNMDSGMYKPIQQAAAVALTLGDDWFNKLNKIYLQRRALVWDLFDMLNCSYSRDASGLFVWAKVPDYIADTAVWVDEILHQARVFITPGFIFGSAGDRYVRIALCTESEVIKSAIKHIETSFIKDIALS